ncbi:Ribosomal protein S18 acetylase RimI [Sphingomonas laterariae]|uniref:Ribosomal protein S18 acetylase RimI n=1 Tax=Edaphosphingomonas laterariae TaxID=861865 RepID=A0A239CZB9_9SPHN|nr:GNAT family N-acetyltransferase [Sphingomonas laterariae]SNS25460.1 Ribosomal protein S18 acetylase RimI [Sphingomonas laterariae]
MSLEPVPAGHLAAIVTSLEMRARPRPAPLPASPFRLVRWQAPTNEGYRSLFRRIGAPWLWFSRLVLSDAALAAIITDPAVQIFAVVDRQGIEVGLLELDFRIAGECELGFFGLIPELAGKGHGGWLMAHALALGWRQGVERMWVHTCTLDHPGALGFYRKAGFVPFARAIEIFADPRLAGILPRDAAPQIPLFEDA